ncbi:MAG: EamA family transporter RarD [Anaerolineales bacterium]|nr:EamA family transporter RarD [Anaerolineales bacterium]
MKRGIWLGIGAYGIWGLFPIYWKWLQHVPALELVAHRIVWSFIMMLVVMTVTRRWDKFRHHTASPKLRWTFLLIASLIGVNWLVYVWAVNAGFIVDASLGYFINPLVSVTLGVVFLKERLRTWQWVPVGMAGAGVIYLTVLYGALPWIALTLAFTFGTYGLLKKITPLGPVQGMALETGILFLPALAWLVFTQMRGDGAFLHSGPVSDLLMAGAGVVTTIPLLMFAAAAQSIPLSLVGILQYLAPTLQFLIGVLVFDEPLSAQRLVGFCIIWLALILFAAEGWQHHRRKRLVVGF